MTAEEELGDILEMVASMRGTIYYLERVIRARVVADRVEARIRAEVAA